MCVRERNQVRVVRRMRPPCIRRRARAQILCHLLRCSTWVKCMPLLICSVNASGWLSSSQFVRCGPLSWKRIAVGMPLCEGPRRRSCPRPQACRSAQCAQGGGQGGAGNGRYSPFCALSQHTTAPSQAKGHSESNSTGKEAWRRRFWPPRRGWRGRYSSARAWAAGASVPHLHSEPVHDRTLQGLLVAIVTVQG